MSCCRCGLFLGGAIIGAAAALLMAPEKGDDLRKRIRKAVERAIERAGVKLCDSEEELDAIVDELTEEIASK